MSATKQEILARNRGRSYSWRADPAYIMKEGHPNKMMRPSTHKLLDKLRNMTMLKEPGMVNVVIYDLAHHFLYKNGEVVLLGKITADLMHLWSGMVQNEEGKPAYIYGQPENQPAPEPPVEPETAQDVADNIIYAKDYEDGAEDGLEINQSFQDQLKTLLNEPQGKVDLKDLIWDHSLQPAKGMEYPCGCGRAFMDREAWADHLRIRIKRFLLNEFPPIGGTSAD